MEAASTVFVHPGYNVPGIYMAMGSTCILFVCSRPHLGLCCLALLGTILSLIWKCPAWLFGPTEALCLGSPPHRRRRWFEDTGGRRGGQSSCP